LRKGLRKLSAYLPPCEEIDTARLHREGSAALAVTETGTALDGYPRIRLVHTARAG
jgi:hypothetical protein